MDMLKVTQAISNFLRNVPHNAPELVARWTPSMETQVNVFAGKGEPVDGKRNTYTDGEWEWFNFRIPKNAGTKPEFKDWPLRWPLDLFAEGIGWTGWDYVDLKSRALGFDFDAITGHAKGVGITDEELDRVREAAIALPYVEVRRSTGGNGLHLYVYFDEAGVPTANHTEHAALGRAVLGMMASQTGFDFASQIDACGGNMWIWHRKMTPQNEGLKLLKAAERPLSISDLPANWRDHIEVVTRRRSKLRVSTDSGAPADPLDELTSARRIVPLDETHHKIKDALRDSGYSCIWVSDHHLLQTHTCALAALMADESLKLKGFFKTSSEGNDPGTPNCFLFPIENGAWRVYRFTPGISEAETWHQDKEGWTNCFFNRPPDLQMAATAHGGKEDPEKGGFSFDEARDALKAVEALGQKIDLPDHMLGRQTLLKAHKDGRLVVDVTGSDTDQGMKSTGWIAKKNRWVRVVNVVTEYKSDDLGFAEYDNSIRQLMTPANEDAGWYLKSSTGEWQRFSTEKIKLALLTHGNSDTEAKLILGGAIRRSWKLVNLPFQPEYPGDRQWNMNAAQFRFPPAILEGDESPEHPHWDRILKHCGQDLDAAVKKDPWCRDNNILSGADYLMMWIACVLRDPFGPLPYLFLYGNQNSGKSILHEAISALMTRGAASADRALTNQNDFNGELANVVLAYIEEKNIAKAEGAYNKIKDLTTSPVIWIRKMRTDAYSQLNMLHFIHCANSIENVPIPPGDTRICVIYVPDLMPDEEIPKRVLMSRLEEEAPHFMRTIMDLTLPAFFGRMRLPAIKNANKETAEALNQTPLEQFVSEQCHTVHGELIEFRDFYDKFREWLPPELVGDWSKLKVVNALRQKFPYGTRTMNKRYIGNVSWHPGEHGPSWFVRDGMLVRDA
jgi:hypothetical protein